MENYCPIQVGAAGKEKLGYLTDDTGDNISLKNPNYCELTGLYWIWKNTHDSYKGLVHYRRYFGKSNFSNKVKDIYLYDEMLRFLNDYDIVLPYIEVFKQNAKEEILVSCCTPEIFDQLRNIIVSDYPEYLKDFDDFFSQKRACLFNMMFTRREIFDDYCSWLFSILFKLEERVDLSQLNDYQKRLYGFLSERLLNVWVKHKDLKAKHVSIINTEDNIKDNILRTLRRYKHNIKK